MFEEGYVKNPQKTKIKGVRGYVTTFGAQDAASGNPADTSWFAIVNKTFLTTRNRDYAQIFSLAVQKYYVVNVGYTDEDDVFIIRLDAPPGP